MPVLSGRYFALLIEYFDSQSVLLAEWDLRTGRNLFLWDIGEGEPWDLELTSDGGLAWLSSALYKKDRLGPARLGVPDVDATCRGDDWCRTTVTLEGDTISWIQGGVVRSYRLLGRPQRRR
jgi:hypothetical protein